jgi:hypothetical protein
MLTLNTVKIELGDNYLEVKGTLTDQEYRDAFAALNGMHLKSLWFIGDFLNATELSKGEAYAEALAVSSYAKGTLYNAKYLCKQITREKRVTGLSFSHHYQALVEANKDKEADVEAALDALKDAAKNDVEAAKMRQQILEKKAAKEAEVALGYLREAAKKDLTVAKMRKLIREDQAALKPEPKPAKKEPDDQRKALFYDAFNTIKRFLMDPRGAYDRALVIRESELFIRLAKKAVLA